MNYYYANENNQPVGPYTAEQLQQFYQQGILHANSWVLVEGTADWQPYANLFSAQAVTPKEEASTNTPTAAMINIVPICPKCGAAKSVIATPWSFLRTISILIGAFVISLVITVPPIIMITESDLQHNAVVRVPGEVVAKVLFNNNNADNGLVVLTITLGIIVWLLMLFLSLAGLPLTFRFKCQCYCQKCQQSWLWRLGWSKSSPGLPKSENRYSR